MQSVSDVVFLNMRLTAAENDKVLAPLSQELLLVDSGLDSLCMAVLIARLDMHFQVEAFIDSEIAALPNTVGDLIALYRDAG